MKNDLMKKNFIWNMIGSAFNAFNSLFFMIVVTRINGLKDAGVFTFGFSLACFLFMIGNYSGRIFQINDDSDISDSDYIYSKIFTCFLMPIIGIGYCFFKEYNFARTLVVMSLIIYKTIEAFCEGMFAIIQEHDQLYKVGISQFLKSILSLGSLLLVDLLTHNLILAIIIMIIMEVLITIFYDLRNLNKLKFKLNKLDFSKVKLTIKIGFYAFIVSFLTQYVINASRYAIDGVLADDMQTIFGIIIMPATLVALLGQFILQPFVLNLKQTLKENKKDFLKLTLKLIFVISLLGIFSTIFLFFFGSFIFKILYGLNLNKYMINLTVIMIGATIYEITVVLSTSLISMKSTLSQAIVFVITSIFTLIISGALVKNYGLNGAVYNYLFSMLLLFVLYIMVFIYVYKKYDKKRSLS